MLVQVVKDEVGDKGAALTAKLSLSGRYLVYIPERDGEGGISSKITDEERVALKKVLEDLQFPDGASVILRTAASDKSVAEFQADLDRLIESIGKSWTSSARARIRRCFSARPRRRCDTCVNTIPKRWIASG